MQFISTYFPSIFFLQCLHMSYTSVVTSDPYSILTQVLSSRFTDRYQLAKKFVSNCNLKSREVCVHTNSIEEIVFYI